MKAYTPWKWVARPVTLYVRDVPILWLPFIFQDLRPGRHSGVLIPQFGINDLVRPTRDYNRQIANIGYYWAPSDYFDLTGRLDWFANRYVQYGIAGQYRWLNRFVDGTFGVNQQRESGGGSGLAVRWDHQASRAVLGQTYLSAPSSSLQSWVVMCLASPNSMRVWGR